MATSRTLRTSLKCKCHSAHIFWCSYSSGETRRLPVDNRCSIAELCNPTQYCLACRNLSIPPHVKMSSKSVTVAESLFLRNVSTANARCSSDQRRMHLKVSNRSTHWRVFHRTIYKDGGMALNLNRPIVSAPTCIFSACVHKTDLLTYLLTYSLTYSMVQSPSREANWFAASQQIPRISRNSNVHYRTQKRPPRVPILGQPNPVHIPTSHLLEIHPNIIHPSMPRSPQWTLSLRFPQQEDGHSH